MQVRIHAGQKFHRLRIEFHSSHLASGIKQVFRKDPHARANLKYRYLSPLSSVSGE